MGDKRRRNKQRTTQAMFVFTYETVDLTLRAVALFEQPLHRADHLTEKVVFAEETVQRVKQKLRQMRESVGALCPTGFDYNEKVILRQAMLMYTIELLDTPSSPKREKALRQCRAIAHSFTDDQGASN